MKKIVLLVLAASMLSAPALYAAEAGSANMSFWEVLRKKIEGFVPQKKIGVTNAVGGVRGAPSDANDIYWKGEAHRTEIDADELAAFKKATDLAAAGETSQAHAAFSEFVTTYPDSTLRKDADQALAALQPAK